MQAFQILLQIGAGTGLLFLLRWFWWRVNAISELVAMVVSLAMAAYFQFLHPSLGPPLADWQKLLIGVGVTTAAWLLAAYLAPATGEETLRTFYRQIRPSGPGWAAVRRRAAEVGESLPPPERRLAIGLACALLGALLVYAALFATGLALYGDTAGALTLALGGVAAGIGVAYLWSRLPKEARSEI